MPRGAGATSDQVASISVRAAEMKDAPSIATLCGQLGYEVSPEQVRERLGRIGRGRDSVAYVAESPKEGVIGWVHVYRRDLIETETDAEIGGLVVGEGYRRRGIGRLLLERAERWAYERGCVAMNARSNIVREDAHSFYQSIGYECVKTQKAFRRHL